MSVFCSSKKDKTTAKINIACSSSMHDQEQHVHQCMCIRSALFLSISFLQSEALRQKNGRKFPGAQSKEEYIRKEIEVKASSAPIPSKQLFVRCLYSTGLEKLKQLKIKASIHPQHYRGLAGLQLVTCYLFLVLIAGSPRNISVIYSAGLSRSN